MKKVFSILPLLLLSFFIIGQDSQLSFGIEIGTTISKLRGNEFVENHDLLYGFSAGLLTEYTISPHFALRSGFAFERKGADATPAYTDQNGEPLPKKTVQLQYDYLILTTTAAYTTNGNLPFYFGAGPYIGLLLKQQDVVKSYDQFSERTRDYTENHKKLDAGLSCELGIKLPLSSHLLLDIGPRANIGLTNTSKIPVINDGSIKVSSIELALGLRYR
ncbi:MAG: PorT family protein [Chitinophagales bacterium]|nr:PorT family protein [Chitinophagales bacterium]